MIAITFALPQESGKLCALLTEPCQQEGGALPMLTGVIGQRRVIICHTGIGEKSAARQMRALWRLHRPRGLVAAGFAGGLDPKLKVGDIHVATNFSCNALLDLTRRVSEEFGGCYFGTLTSQAAVAETAGQKAALAQGTGASAVDMETGTIAAACGEHSVPMLSARAISDVAGAALPVPFPMWFNMETQSPRVPALLGYLATHPARIAPFARFVGDVNTARARLTKYLLRLLEAM